jgi:hypothetical protein
VGTSPTNGFPQGPATFFWNPPQGGGVNTYQVNVYDEDKNQHKLVASFTTSGNNTSVLGNVSSGAIGGSFNFSWEVVAIIGGKIVCTTPLIPILRQSQATVAPNPPNLVLSINCNNGSFTVITVQNIGGDMAQADTLIAAFDPNNIQIIRSFLFQLKAGTSGFFKMPDNFGAAFVSTKIYKVTPSGRVSCPPPATFTPIPPLLVVTFTCDDKNALTLITITNKGGDMTQADNIVFTSFATPTPFTYQLKAGAAKLFTINAFNQEVFIDTGIYPVSPQNVTCGTVLT